MKTKSFKSESALLTVSEHRSLRRLINQVFDSFLKNQQRHCQTNSQEILRKLQDIEDMLEIMAHEMARQAKRGN